MRTVHKGGCWTFLPGRRAAGSSSTTTIHHPFLQRDALQADGCERVFDDMVSGARADRTWLSTLMSMLRAGDTVVIWRLDRLGRLLKNLIELVERLESAKVGLRSLQEKTDTTSTCSAHWPSSSAT